MTDSWWVGKDRNAFNVALKDHTQRVMRRELPVVPPPDPPAVIPPTPEIVAPLELQKVAREQETRVPPIPSVVDIPPVEATPLATRSLSNHWNAANIKKGLCARCGEPRTHYAQHCDRCQAKYLARVQRRTGFHAWRPGSRGRPPIAVRSLLKIAAALDAAIRVSDEAVADDALGRAAIIMVVGFLFRQRLDWIVGWTRFPRAECQHVAARLRRYGIWGDDGTLVCHWMEGFSSTRRLPKRERGKADLNFWLDAMVAKGDLTREPADGDFRYGLVEWERKAVAR